MRTPTTAQLSTATAVLDWLRRTADDDDTTLHRSLDTVSIEILARIETRERSTSNTQSTGQEAGR